MDSQTPAALTLGPGGNDTFYDESTPECDPREDRAGKGVSNAPGATGETAPGAQRNSPMTASSEAGATRDRAKSSRACSGLEAPTSAQIPPGADRENWSARCAG